METEFDERASKIGAAITHGFLVSCGLTANGLLFYAIVRHTPASFKNYSSLLFLTAINDTVCLLCDSILIQRILPTPTIIAQVWHESCYYIFSVYLHTMTNSIALITVSFWYRYLVLRKSSPPSPFLLGAVVFVFYLPSFVQMWAILVGLPKLTDEDSPNWGWKRAGVTLPLSMWSDEHVKEVLSVYYPTLDYAHGPVTGNASNGDIYADYGTILALIFPFPCYTFILTVRYKILRAINISQLSERTREMHKELVRALSFHACLPILNVTATTITTIMLMDIIRHPALENVVFIFASLPSCISPILTLNFIRPYRVFFLHLIGRNSSKDSTTSKSTVSKSMSNEDMHRNILLIFRCRAAVMARTSKQIVVGVLTGIRADNCSDVEQSLLSLDQQRHNLSCSTWNKQLTCFSCEAFVYSTGLTTDSCAYYRKGSIEEALIPISCVHIKNYHEEFVRCLWDTNDNCAVNLANEQARISKAVTCALDPTGSEICTGDWCYVQRLNGAVSTTTTCNPISSTIPE
ncbi:hypothetical protein PRIPAC_84359 [Pristionchus pacificus]|uniref:G protein-coupled receptor n=1 Tax=Pristionchus pacificus TaxID=54126 RepID=A0A2A6BSX9_PRIPA|nr:hypothetical protein PRIPAC_84359 [Pristionchus pacificus]|eukprot:PDM68998.1 G protein-coupled receptor [Pristionchus pacificus]